MIRARLAAAPLSHVLGKVYEQPEVEPQVLHFMQVPLRTKVKLPQAPQLSPSKPFIRASATRLAWASRTVRDDSTASMLATCAPTGFNEAELGVSTISIPAR